MLNAYLDHTNINFGFKGNFLNMIKRIDVGKNLKCAQSYKS